MSEFNNEMVIESLDDFNNKLQQNNLNVIFFWAEWHEPSKKNGALFQLYLQLKAAYNNNIAMYTCEAESIPEISMKYEITVVPTFIFLRNNEIIDRLEGVNPSELTHKLKSLSQYTTNRNIDDNTNTNTVNENVNDMNERKENEELNQRIHNLIRLCPVMLFMKGTPANPKCKFSRKMIELLTTYNIEYGSFNILEDNDVRQGLKTYSNWPTYPQLYVKGELIGGLDIINELIEESNKLNITLSEKLGLETLNERLSKLINRNDIMLFMKGNPDEPKCGFSRQMVEILRNNNINFDSFDILSDNTVRQGLKTYSNWPTYPQLYVKGELIGGLDIIKEMNKSNDLPSQLGIETLDIRLKNLINSADIMLFMKGSPHSERCGFSRQIVEILDEKNVIGSSYFNSFDILTDNDVRQGLKTYSNWPTYPQLYIKGELVGGLDIVKEMNKSNDLDNMIKEIMNS